MSPTQQLICEVEARVRCHLGGQVRHLRFQQYPEGLVISGRARSYHARQEAEDLATELTGLRVLANEIEVA
jgi:hypothetical protein